MYAIVAEKEKAYDEDKKNHEDILNKEYHRFGGCRFTDDVKESLSGKATDGGTDGKHDASPVDPLISSRFLIREALTIARVVVPT